MLRRTFAYATIALALSTLAAADASAVQRTFVASYGLATNTLFNCSIVKPCRTFSDAIGVTNSGGEVIVLDSAGYGPVTITKSVALIAPAGIYAGITVSSGDGVTINAPGGDVVLRGLAINGQGGNIGIRALEVAQLRIESCTISNMGGAGIAQDVGIGVGAGVGAMFVIDTTVRDSKTGISAVGGQVVLDRVRSERNVFNGLSIAPLKSPMTATISNSVFAFNGQHGVSVASISGDRTRAQVEWSVMANNTGDGITISGAGSGETSAGVSRNSIHNNLGSGVSLIGLSDGLVLATVSDNMIHGNHVYGISADGPNSTIIWASSNTVNNSDGGNFVQKSSASFRTLGNNVGGFISHFGDFEKEDLF